MKRMKFWFILVCFALLLSACGEQAQKKESANGEKTEEKTEKETNYDVKSFSENDITKDDYLKGIDVKDNRLFPDEAMEAAGFPIYKPSLGKPFNRSYSRIVENKDYKEVSTWFYPLDETSNIRLKYIATQINVPAVLKEFQDAYPVTTVAKDETAQSFHWVLGDVYYRYIYFIDEGQEPLDEEKWKEDIFWLIDELKEMGEVPAAAEEEAAPSKALTVEEAHVEADKIVEKYLQTLDQEKIELGTEYVSKINIIPDEYPEIVLLEQTTNGNSQISFLRYITENKLFQSVKNDWVTFYRNDEHDNAGEFEPLQYFGTIAFSEGGPDYPVIGKIAGSGGFLGFQVFGYNKDKEDMEVKIDRMGADYLAGELVLDGLVEFKMDVKSKGKVVETFTSKDIK